MNLSDEGRLVSTRKRRFSSITLVAVGLVAALVAVLAWPALDAILRIGSHPQTVGEE